MRKLARISLSLMMVVLLLGSFVGVMLAASYPPHGFEGWVFVDDALVGAGTEVTAWIDGVQYCDTTTPSDAGWPDYKYRLWVPSDDISTPGVKEGGVDGNIIQFKIKRPGDMGYLVAEETEMFLIGRYYVDYHLHADSEAVLEGQVNLQGRFAGPPDDSWITPLTVVLFEEGTSTIIGSPHSVDTNTNGFFTIDELEPTVCDIAVKCPRSLSQLATGVVLSSGVVGVSFGTLLEGDADDDDYIGPFDYSTLRLYYGETSPQALDACDFNRDEYVDGFDYSLLRMNYGTDGEMPVWPLP